MESRKVMSLIYYVIICFVYNITQLLLLFVFVHIFDRGFD